MEFGKDTRRNSTADKANGRYGAQSPRAKPKAKGAKRLGRSAAALNGRDENEGEEKVGAFGQDSDGDLGAIEGEVFNDYTACIM